jgi:hypothetical protein
VTDRLRNLADQATENARTGVPTPEGSRADDVLSTLAPDMARLLSDMADALESSKSFDENDAALLARFQELEERA